MTDSEKIELIKNMICNFWECCSVSEDSLSCLVSAITTVTDFYGKEEENAEN